MSILGERWKRHYIIINIYICLFIKVWFSYIIDPPRIDLDALEKFSKPVIVRVGETAEWKLPFSGEAPMTVQWYKDDEELLPGLTVRMETSSNDSQLRLTHAVFVRVVIHQCEGLARMKNGWSVLHLMISCHITKRLFGAFRRRYRYPQPAAGRRLKDGRRSAFLVYSLTFSSPINEPREVSRWVQRGWLTAWGPGVVVRWNLSAHYKVRRRTSVIVSVAKHQLPRLHTDYNY